MSESNNKKYRIVIRSKAKRNLLDIYRYMLDQNFSGAKAWADGLVEAIGTLEESPMRCSLAPESRIFQKEIRQLLYGKKTRPYRVLFTVEESTVSVISIRHASQDVLGSDEYLQ